MNKILIIGLGLIGGSFAKALRQQKISREIWAFDPDIATINSAKNSKIIDGFAILDQDLQNFDLIVIATPLAFYKDILAKISELDPKNSIIIDLGSLKECVLKTLPQNLQKNFIACHPIAGSDKTGFDNSSSDLFFDKKFIICRGKNTEEKFLKTIENIAIKIGAKPNFIEAKAHDEIYGLVSHLPQFLSFLTKEFSPEKQNNDFIKNAFRLDNSSAEIWEDIFKMNRKNLEKFYIEFFDNLNDFATAIRQKKYDELLTNLINIAAPLLETLPKPDFATLPQLSKVIFRLIIVVSYLKIKKIQNLQNYAGRGFKDFTSIISVLKLDREILLKTIENEQKEVLSFIRKISL